jgi:nucleoside-diphosphate-sugar epimerase
MTMQKVLVMGASGLIGGLVVRNLADKYDFSALNRCHVDGIPYTQADIADFDAILPAFEGMDMVVHMANYTLDAQTWEKHLTTGIISTRKVYEAARIHGVNRVVYGGTGDTQTGYEYDKSLAYGELAAGKYDEVPDEWPIVKTTDPVRPKSVYGACKAFGEALRRYHSDVYDMSVICIRLGAVLSDNVPTLRRQYPGYLDQRDCVDIVDKWLSLPLTVKYDIVNALSDNKYGWRDADHTREALGYVPVGSPGGHKIDDVSGWHQV